MIDNGWGPFCQVSQYPLIGDIRPLRLVQVSEELKETMLPSPPPQGKPRSLDLLDRVRRIDPWTAEKLGSKHDAVDKFAFRLVYTDDKETSRPPSFPNVEANHLVERTSYIVLSYCWHSRDWRPALGLMYDPWNWQTTHMDPAYPLIHPMWSALLAERTSDSEPVWVDQYCITQSDETAKLAAIGSMDLVYANARKVVVALEDAQLNPKDMTTLLDYANYLKEGALTPDDMETVEGLKKRIWVEERQGDLWAATSKIFASRWFFRAWCAHEMWTGKGHTYLAPVTVGNPMLNPSLAPVSILRFNTTFLLCAHRSACQWLQEMGDPTKQSAGMLQYVSQLEGDIEYQKEILKAGIKSTAKLAFTHSTIMSQYTTTNILPPFLSTYAITTTLSCFVASDKLAIALNANRTGLYLLSSSQMTPAEASWIMTIVSLAAGDTAALAAMGRQIGSLGAELGQRPIQETGWACVPRVDVFLRQGSKSFNQDVDVKVCSKGLAMEVMLLELWSIQPPDPRYVDLAVAILDTNNYSKWDYTTKPDDPEDPSMDRLATFLDRPYLRKSEKDVRNQRLRKRHLAQAIACILQQGNIEWAFDCATKLKPAVHDPVFYVQMWERLIDAVEMLQFESLDQSATALLQSVATGNDVSSRFHALITVASGLIRTAIGEPSEYRDGEIDGSLEFQFLCSHL
jgi:hypothetical protein